jgi:hypothetical protein
MTTYAKIVRRIMWVDDGPFIKRRTKYVYIIEKREIAHQMPIRKSVPATPEAFDTYELARSWATAREMVPVFTWNEACMAEAVYRDNANAVYRGTVFNKDKGNALLNERKREAELLLEQFGANDPETGKPWDIDAIVNGK